MKLMTALALILLTGCATYVGKDGRWSDSAAYETRECGAEVKNSAQYPTRADSFTPGGMDRSAVRIQELTDACMTRKGFKPSA